MTRRKATPTEVLTLISNDPATLELVRQVERLTPGRVRIVSQWQLSGDSGAELPAMTAPPTPPSPANSSTPQERLIAALQALFAGPETRQLYALLEKTTIEQAYRYTRGNQVHTARLLGITRNIARALLKKHGLLTPVGGQQHPAREEDRAGQPGWV
jgi:DNA-binding protein Fis